jgi:hypothetical protein
MHLRLLLTAACCASLLCVAAWRAEPQKSAPATAPTTAPATAPASQPASQPAASQPAPKMWKEYHSDNKTLRAQCPMVRDPQDPKKWVKHGLWQSWFADGKLEKEGKYKYGKMDGEWKIWFRGVDKPFIEKWIDGKKVNR